MSTNGQPSPPPRFIVAEISKNWCDDTADSTLLSRNFEQVIAVNLERGYLLHSWKLSRVVTDTPPCVNETIVAVFEHGL